MKQVKQYPDKFSDYAIVNNHRYRHFQHNINDGDTTPWKLCVPTPLREKVIKENHDSVAGGHLGIRKTINKVAGRY